MQNNVPSGSILRRTAGADLAAKLLFVAMLNSSDAAVLHNGALAKPYLIVDAGASGAEVGLKAIDSEPVRIKCAGVIDEGAAVYLDVATGQATATASAIRLGFAEEDKASGAGDVLVRPDVQIAPVGTLAPLALTIGGSYNQTQVQNISDKVDAVIAALKLAR
jgi:hypothetical protein